MGQGKKPDRKTLAKWKVASDLGNSANAIAKDDGVSHKTVLKYLRSDVYSDPKISEIVERIREKELNDLTVIGAKARQRIHDIFDTGKPALIPAVACMDRSFTQRRLLEGKGAENISNLTAIIQAAHGLGKNGKEVMEVKVSVQTGVNDTSTEQADVTPGQ